MPDEGSLRRLCVYCGSSHGRRPTYTAAARELGALLVEREIGLVYGGGCVGLMGVIADAVLEKGGEVHGVIPEKLAKKEVMHEGLTELHVVKSMHERKALMEELADAFVALPGGFGTFEEIFEMITWGQLGIHRKPIGLLNLDGFYDGFLQMVQHAVSEGFIREGYLGLFRCELDVARLLEAMETFEPVEPILKVLGLDES